MRTKRQEPRPVFSPPPRPPKVPDLEKQITDLLPLVRRIVRCMIRTQWRRANEEDFFSTGSVALVRAVRNYDPARGASLRTWVSIRVRGAVLDEIRARTFVPTALYGKIQSVQAGYQKFLGDNRRPPNDEELSQAAGIPESQLSRISRASRTGNFRSLDRFGATDSTDESLDLADRHPGPQQQAETHERSERLTQARQQLPSRDRRILRLYYDQNATLKQIARSLNLTESRISQLHKVALLRLRQKLQPREYTRAA